MTLQTPQFYFSSDPILSDDARTALSEQDAIPAIFEWYQHVGLTAHHVANISEKSGSYSLDNPIRWAVLKGLLHRCSRLMLANVALTHEGLFGDAAKIIDRCIFETAIKARWLCHSEEFDRYLATSLKPEQQFKTRLNADIALNEEGPSAIQTRMLASIERHRRLSGVSWEDVATSKKLPPIDSMISALGMDPLIYIVSQQLGSHAIHGSWPSLLDDYLVVGNSEDFGLRDHDVEPHPAQFAAAIQRVLEATADVILYAFAPPDSSQLAGSIRALQSRFEAFYRKYNGEPKVS